LFLEGDGEGRQGWNQILEIFEKSVTDLEDALSSV